MMIKIQTLLTREAAIKAAIKGGAEPLDRSFSAIVTTIQQSSSRRMMVAETGLDALVADYAEKGYEVRVVEDAPSR